MNYKPTFFYIQHFINQYVLKSEIYGENTVKLYKNVKICSCLIKKTPEGVYSNSSL